MPPIGSAETPIVSGGSLFLIDLENRMIAIDIKTGKTVIQVNPKFYRPAEVELLIGDPEKARTVLGWETNTSLEQLCQLMVDADLERVKTGKSF